MSFQTELFSEWREAADGLPAPGWYVVQLVCGSTYKARWTGRVWAGIGASVAEVARWKPL